MKQATKARAGPTNIAIVGAGGIGSALTHLLVRSLHDGELVRKIGGTNIALFDSDVVEQRNTLFQLFCHQDVGKKKVECLKESLSEFEGDLLEIQAIAEDIRSPGDLANQDLVLVCVDSSLGGLPPTPRDLSGQTFAAQRWLHRIGPPRRERDTGTSDGRTGARELPTGGGDRERQPPDGIRSSGRLGGSVGNTESSENGRGGKRPTT